MGSECGQLLSSLLWDRGLMRLVGLLLLGLGLRDMFKGLLSMGLGLRELEELRLSGDSEFLLS